MRLRFVDELFVYTVLSVGRLAVREGELSVFKRDTLLRRLLLSYSALSLFLLGVLVLGLWCLIWPNFTRIEKEESLRRVEAASRIVHAEAARVTELANTYAVWDEAYRYMGGGNPKFPAENFSASALAQIDIDAVVLQNGAGKILFAYDSAGGKTGLTDLERSISTAPGLRLAADEDAKSGLMIGDGQVFFASTRRIVHTDGTGPSNGSIVFLRRIDSDVMARISALANVELKLRLDPAAPARADHIRGSARLEDVFGRPVIRVDILGQKEIADLGAVSLLVFLAFVVLAWCGTGVALALFLGRDVVGPVFALRDHVAARQSGATSHFHKTRSPEEVRALAQTFDATFSQLEAEMARHRDLVNEAQSARAAAETANAAKTRFLANMSHELRTPLSSIKSYAELLRDVAEEDGRTQDVADVGEIITASRHLLGLVNSILDLSKVEAGKMTLDYSSVDLGELARNVATLVTPLAEENADTLIVQVADAPSCVTDEQKLRQCLLNLAANAIKFTSNGEVRISVAPMTRNGADWFCLEVQDTGIGISAEAMQRLFKPFSQADETTTRKFGGTGLGLALTKQLIEAMGGYVEMESVEGAGSTFRLAAPCAPAGAAPALLGEAA